MRTLTCELVLVSIWIGASGFYKHADDSNTVRDGDYHYKLYNIDATFFEAEDLCVAQGGHLASIHSQEENELIYWLTTNEQPATKESDHTWIGLRRKLLLWNHLAENQKQSYGEWVWTDGTPADYTEWAHDQPDNLDKGESCVQMFNAATGTIEKHFDQMAWNDLKCSSKMKSFVCKFKN